jgi:hypothetical protein
VLLVLALVPRLRREFKRPGVYLLIGMFVLCTIPPIVWNAQHAWITLAHLRSRGNLDRGFGFHPLRCSHFSVNTSSSIRRCCFWRWPGVLSQAGAHQSAIQSPVFNVVWFAGVWFLLASVVNKSAAPNWDGLAFFGFGLVASISGGNGFRRAFFYAYAPESPSWWD